jgi:predicted nucleic-acid-binding protein
MKILDLLGNVWDLPLRENRKEALAQAVQLIEASEFSADRKTLFITATTNYANGTH